MLKISAIKCLKEGDLVLLKDDQTLNELADQGKFETELSVTVNEVLTFTQEDNNFSYKFVSFKEREDLFLVIFYTDQDFEYHVCFYPNEDIKPDSYYIFLKKNPWITDDTLYNEEGVEFNLSNYCFFGDCNNDPAVLKIFHSNEPTENPIIFTLQYGDLVETGGMMYFLNGVSVTDNDVRINFLGEE